MKKLFSYLLVTLVSLFSFTSCTIDNGMGAPYYIPIAPVYVYGYYAWQPYSTNAYGQYAIGGYVNGQQATRAALQTGDGASYTNFALYSWTADSVVMNGYNGAFSGNTWGYSEAVKYFDNDVDEYNFIGVIPNASVQSFDAATGTVTATASGFITDEPLAQEIGKYTDTEELLYAATTVAKANYSTGATLNFQHANAKVYIKFTSDDADTEILDFKPSIGGTPAGPDVNIYRIAAEPIKYYGPTVAAAEGAGLTDADIAEVNSHFNFTVHNGYYWAAGTQTWSTITGSDWPDYVSSSLFSGYWSDNNGGAAPTGIDRDLYPEFTGDFTVNGSNKLEMNFDGWNYLVTKYPDIANIALENWASAISGGMKLVHITKENGNLRGWWINTTNTHVYLLRTEPGTPAVPGTPAINGIIVMPATSVIGNGTDAIAATYPTSVSAAVTLNGTTLTETTNAASVTFTKPAGYVYTTRVASPTTWFTFPAAANSVANVGYTVKFSYTYKGVTKYDNRVFLPASECQWLEGKYYTYIINIKGKGNGFVDPADVDLNDPKVPQTNQIVVTASVIDYEADTEYEHDIK